MKNSAPKFSASTQKFTEIRDIKDDIVLLKGGNSCIVIEVTSVNFTLLSPEEQDAKISAYASLLNSLSFPVQIVIRSKQIDIEPYLASLEYQVSQTQNSKLAGSIRRYKDFVSNLVKTTTVLDKKFYLIISYSSLEGTIKTAGSIAIKEPDLAEFFTQAKTALHTKLSSLLPEIDRLGLKTTVLQKEDLVHMFHDIYNPGQSFSSEVVHSEILTKGGDE